MRKCHILLKNPELAILSLSILMRSQSMCLLPVSTSIWLSLRNPLRPVNNQQAPQKKRTIGNARYAMNQSCALPTPLLPTGKIAM